MSKLTKNPEKEGPNPIWALVIAHLVCFFLLGVATAPYQWIITGIIIGGTLTIDLMVGLYYYAIREEKDLL